MAKIKFSAGQFNKPTPLSFVRIVMIYTAASGFFNTWLQSGQTLIGPNTAALITQITNLINGLAAVILPFFGVDTKEQEIPVEDVNVIDDTKTDS